MYADDTIAAIATPPGFGGIGIIRVSGPLCAAIAEQVFARASATVWESHRLYHGHLLDGDGQLLDEGLAVLMRRPRSYTTEDVLELHCHGSPVVLRRVLAAVLRGGARLAEPGEFTRRAFLNGRLDLTQAEAVLDLIRARSGGAAALAARQLTGALGEHLAGLRGRLIGLKALLEAQIDFPEDEVEVTTDQLILDIDTCLGSIKDLIATFARGAMLREGVRVAIIGKPNVGKSSLLNALLGAERAIVTPVAGTTRDTIEETADFEGVAVVLSDTAGLRAAAEADSVERLGIERTRATVAQAQVLLTVLDASAPLDDQDLAVLRTAADRAHVLVLNKVDLPQVITEAEVSRLANGSPVVSASATEGSGLSALQHAVIARCSRSRATPDATTPVLSNARHRDALEKAERSLELARASIGSGRPADLIAVDVQDAIEHVGAITGVVTSEDVLDRVFSEFCIGK